MVDGEDIDVPVRRKRDGKLIPAETVPDPVVKLKPSYQRRELEQPTIRLAPWAVKLREDLEAKGLPEEEIKGCLREESQRRVREYCRHRPDPIKRKPVKKGSWTYFVQEEDHGPIKIGKVTVAPADSYPTVTLKGRLSSLQSANPRKLELLGATREIAEKAAHTMFAHLRIRGEWFRPAAELYAFIDEVCDG